MNEEEEANDDWWERIIWKNFFGQGWSEVGDEGEDTEILELNTAQQLRTFIVKFEGITVVLAVLSHA